MLESSYFVQMGDAEVVVTWLKHCSACSQFDACHFFLTWCRFGSHICGDLNSIQKEWKKITENISLCMYHHIPMSRIWSHLRSCEISPRLPPVQMHSDASGASGSSSWPCGAPAHVRPTRRASGTSPTQGGPWPRLRPPPWSPWTGAGRQAPWDGRGEQSGPGADEIGGAGLEVVVAFVGSV